MVSCPPQYKTPNLVLGFFLCYFPGMSTDRDGAEQPNPLFYPPEPCENPARKGWPASLVVDMALGGASDEAICSAYELQQHELDNLREDPAFLIQVAAVEKEIQKEGVSFRMKARLQAEELLMTSWGLIHSPATPASVKAGLIKDTVRWAGWDAPAQEAGAGRGGFSVNIVLNNTGGSPTGITIDQPAQALPA